MERGEDEFGRGKLGEMGFESRGPWSCGRGKLLGCGRHVAKEGAETEDW